MVSRSIRYGISRGVFSNEAGLGTLAVLHGPAEDTTPHEQGMWAMFEVFFDTVILCTLTALVILCMTGPALDAAPYEGAALAAWCFSGRLGIAGEYLVSGSMVVFVPRQRGQAGCCVDAVRYMERAYGIPKPDSPAVFI